MNIYNKTLTFYTRLSNLSTMHEHTTKICLKILNIHSITIFYHNNRDDTIYIKHIYNNLAILLVVEGKDFQLADSSTATTNAIQDMVLSFIEWSE